MGGSPPIGRGKNMNLEKRCRNMDLEKRFTNIQSAAWDKRRAYKAGKRQQYSIELEIVAFYSPR
jgi:hypothetical protein